MVLMGLSPASPSSSGSRSNSDILHMQIEFSFHKMILVGLTAILGEAWTTSQPAQDKREKIQALSLVKECYSMNLDLLTNATVIDDAIRFISPEIKREDKIIF